MRVRGSLPATAQLCTTRNVSRHCSLQHCCRIIAIDAVAVPLNFVQIMIMKSCMLNTDLSNMKLTAVACAALVASASAFVAPSSILPATRHASAAALSPRASSSSFVPATAAVHRHQGLARPSCRAGGLTMGLFGLGAPEIAVIIVVAALVLGPEKLTSFAKDAGKMAGELKEVPKEFQAGINEGEASMREQMKSAKSLEPVDAEIKETVKVNDD
jgi:sec-independent protein translocase protein TatA